MTTKIHVWREFLLCIFLVQSWPMSVHWVFQFGKEESLIKMRHTLYMVVL